MKITQEKFNMIRALFNKVDLESLIARGAPDDTYEQQIAELLERIEIVDKEQIQDIILTIFLEAFGYDHENNRYDFLPKLSSDIYRVLILDEFKAIDKITIYYNNPSYTEHDYSEEICIDGKKEEITYTRAWDSVRKLLNSFYIPHFASSFIDEYSLLFQYFGEYDFVYDNNEPYVEINVFFEDNTENRMVRMYNRHGIPQEWMEFIDDLGTLMYSFGMFGDLFREEIYNRGVLDGEYIFLSVVFNDYGKEYYYLTTDDRIEVGDMVIVPVGDKMEKKICRVTKKEYFKPNHAPMPIDKVKSIIALCDRNDIDT